MSNTIKGKVVDVGAVQTFGDNGFKKSVLVVDNSNDDKYPSPVPCEFIKDNADKIAGLNPGDLVEVECFINGREYSGKYYCNVTGYKFTIVQGEAPAGGSTVDDSDQIPF